MAFAFLIRFPLSKSAPLAICAFMILSVSSIKMGMKRNAIDIIMAISCTGRCINFRGLIAFSIPSVRLLGVVVSVMMEEPIISMVSLTAMSTAILIPSLVIFSFQMVIKASPGVRNRLKITVSKSKNNIERIPFTIYLKGTVDKRITANKNKAAQKYPQIFVIQNRDIINTTVPASFTRGSSL